MLNVKETASFRPDRVLFLHGFMGSSDDWAEMIEVLADTCHCLAVDLPGHGASTGLTDEVYTMDGATQALVEVLDEHSIAQCTVVGYSMGGRLALYFALRFPQRCRALVLVSASPGLATAEERAARRAVDAERAERLEREDVDRFLNEWYHQTLFASLARHEGLIEQMTARRRRNDPRELARSLRGMGTGSQSSLWERLPALQVSTVAVAGALDPKYVEIARRMASLSDRVRTVVVPEAGHNVYAEQPRRFITLLDSFLKQP